MNVSALPTLNASLNALASLFLILGWLAIRSGNPERHKKMMMTAFAISFLFLISYLTYHYFGPGVTRYQKQGILRYTYFAILLTHTPLAAVVPFAAILAVWHAFRGNFTKHTRITKWLLPVWLYVSVTGVLIYLMLYVF